MTDNKFALPPKIDSYLSVLNRLYAKQKETLLRELVVNAAVTIHEGWDYDNWNGGTYGHAVTLTVSEDLYFRTMQQKDEMEKRIATDLNGLDNSQNEHVSKVFIEMELVGNDNWRKETGVYRPRALVPSVAPEALQRIWGSGHVRVFLSHKASIKEATARVKQSLTRCGIDAFVAHEDIEPTLEWQGEIERALFSMDALVALLTGDFHDSNWTDQEVGVAIGRGVPIIPIRLGKDPYGLMGKTQGLGGCNWDDTDAIAVKVFQLLHKRLTGKSRMFECALTAYTDSNSWADSAWKVEHLLSEFTDLSASQVERIIESYYANTQNSSSFLGTDLLKSLLEKWTKDQWVIHNNMLRRIPTDTDVEVPF